MNKLRFLVTILFVAIFFYAPANAQIILKGYRCKFYEHQRAFEMGEFCSTKDTFLFTFYGKDVFVADTGEKNHKEYQRRLGLEYCFGNTKYTTTKDDLCIQTGQNAQGIYYYLVYVPDQCVSVSVRCAGKGALLSTRSSWLLSQVRIALKNKKRIFFLDEKGRSCQNPDHPEY